MRQGAKSFTHRLLYPSMDINQIVDIQTKKEAILADLSSRQYKISSAHGVATWPLEVLSYITDKDPDLARQLLSNFTYASI